MLGVSVLGEDKAEGAGVLGIYVDHPDIVESRGDLPVGLQPQLLLGGAAVTGSLLLGGV